MVTALVDSSIIIDLLRGFPDAQTWLKTQTDVLGVTHIVWLEVVQGATNKHKQRAAVRLLSDFALVDTTSDDMRWAMTALLKVNLTHNVDALDCLIAATSRRLQVPLFTRNLKHFSPLLDKLAHKPY